jgi:anti-sigma factor RsiW
MSSLSCFWNRARIEPFADAALPPRPTRAVARHLAGCVSCRDRVQRLTALRSQVRGAAAEPLPPDWSGFWAGVRSRIDTDPARPLREPWWLPFWKPVWGHPRVALATGLATVMLVSVPFWPVDESEVLPAWAGPVMVQDVSTEDPDGSVMVYSDPDRGAERGVTVIWVFASR